MKKRLLMILFIAVSFGLAYGQTAPTNGSGTEADPYQIATFDNLLWIYADDTRWSLHYIQTADITCTSNWVRVGSSGTPFTGSYDGQNRTIDSLHNSTVSGGLQGFFGKTDGATVENITLTNVNITGEGNMGSLIGICLNSTITNCTASGVVTGDTLATTPTGGLIGDINTSTVTNCHCDVEVTNNYSGDQNDVHVAGFAGIIRGTGSVVTNCYAEGDVSVPGGGDWASTTGGFGGYLFDAITVSKCYATGNVETHATEYSSAGGFAGYVNFGAVVSECYSRGNVTGSQRTGGFVGVVRNSGSKVENSYSFGNVVRNTVGGSSGGSETQIGGFVGYNRADAVISNCYSVGSVTYTGAIDPSDKGFAGRNDNTITNCFFDKDVSNQNTDIVATAETTTNMQTEATFTAVGWDFTSIWEIVGGDGANYPTLQNSPAPLPVESTLFEAEVKDGSVLLTWLTATEINNYGFEVQKLTDKWNTIGFVAGAGNSNSPRQYSFVDSDANGSTSYRLKQVDLDGSSEYSVVLTVEVDELAKTELYQNYPNPFNPSTVINFNLAKASNVKVSVFNVLGEKVAELVNSKMEAGNHSVNFNASNLTSGIYLYKIETPSYAKSMKMMLLK